MTREQRARDIKAALVQKGVSQAEIARRCGVTRGHVNMVIKGAYRSATVVRALIDAGVPKKFFDEDVDDGPAPAASCQG